MTDAGFFKGTNTDQDSRFADKKKKLLRSMKFGDNLSEKVDTQKVNVGSIKPWIVKRITELLSYEDDIVCDFVVNMLSEQFPDPKDIQINLTAFLGSKSARIFVTELWDLLISAMNTAGGVPAILLEAKKVEILSSRTLEEKFRNEQSSRQAEGAPASRPRDHGDGPFPDHIDSPTVAIPSHRLPSPSPNNDRKETRHRRRYSSSSNSERERSRSKRRFREEESKVDVAEHSGWGRRRRRRRSSYSRSPSNRRNDHYPGRHNRRGHYSPRDRRFEEMDAETGSHGYHDRSDRNRPLLRETRRRPEGRDADRAHNSDGPICVPREVTSSLSASQRRKPLPVAEADVNGGRNEEVEKEENIERPHRVGKRSLPSTPPENVVRRSDDTYHKAKDAYQDKSSWHPEGSYERRRSGHLTMENETYVEERRRHGNHEEEDEHGGSKSRHRRHERHGVEMGDVESRRQHRLPPSSSFGRLSPEGPLLPPLERDEKRERTRRERDVPLASPEGPELPSRITNQGMDDKGEKKKKKSSRRHDSSSSSSSSLTSSSSSSSSSDPSSDEEESSDSSSDSDTSSTDSVTSSSSDNSDAHVSKVNVKKRTTHRKKKDKVVKKVCKHKKKAKSSSKKKKKEIQTVKEKVRKEKKEPKAILPPEGPELPPPLVDHESPGVEWKERRREDGVDDASVSSSSSSSNDSSTESSSSSSTGSSSGSKHKMVKKSGLKRARADDDAIDVDNERAHKRRNDDVIESSKHRLRNEDAMDIRVSNREEKIEGVEPVEGRGGGGGRNEEDRLRRRALESLKRKHSFTDAQ